MPTTMVSAPALEPSTPQSAPYGTWPSPISSTMIAKMSISTEDVIMDRSTHAVYCIEKRPDEGGRNVVVSLADGRDVFGAGWDARTAVHEYGGASAAVLANALLFSNLSDGQVYEVDLVHRTPPSRVTDVEHARFADFEFHPQARNLVVCIMEDHTKPAPKDVVNALVYFNTRSSGKPTTLFSGSDFYSTPRFNSDGTLLAWTQWSHPDMPWDGEQLLVAAVDLSNGHLRPAPERLASVRIAGRASAISATQPTWLDSHTLLFSCDISGYHNPWIGGLDTATQTFAPRALFAQPMDLDFVDPSWILGGSNIACLDETHVLFAASKDGRAALHLVGLDGSCAQIPTPFVRVVRMRRVAHHQVVFVGSRVDMGPALVLASFSDEFAPTFTTLGPQVPALEGPLSDPFISRPVPLSLSLPVRPGEEPQPLHLVYYAPKHPAYIGPADTKPPAVINVHGGPTLCESQSLSLEKQFYTTRGWLWVDVNYSGSSNYGRKYADRLKGNWGVADVQDCVQAAVQLSSPEYSLIDKERIVIRGASAGGYTTLVALSQSDRAKQVFAAGSSLCGISDMQKLTKMTHKFQSWYAQTLVGGTFEQIPEIYRARSPVFHAQNIQVPLLILQGAVDPVVPPNQAEDMIRVIRERGGTAEYVLFEGEGHGWRRAENISRALDVEIEFYQRVLQLM